MLKKKKSWGASVAIIALLLLFVSILWHAPNSMTVTAAKKPVEPLPTVGSMKNLKSLLAEYEKSMGINSDQMLRNKEKLIMEDMAIAPPLAQNEVAGAAGSGNKAQNFKAGLSSNRTSADYSATNVQVQGVDEADIVKTDGNYIYQVNRQEVVVIKAIPAGQMQVVSRIKLDSPGFTPRELFLDSKHLVVIGDTYSEVYAQPMPRTESKIRIYPPPTPRESGVLALLYDISDKKQIKKCRELELEGNYLSSRKIGSNLYLVSNRHLNWYQIQEDENRLLPSYRDTAVSDDFKQIDCAKINYFPGEIYPAYILIAAVDIERNDPAQLKTCLGNGENIYASASNLYIAVSRQEPFRPLLRDSQFPTPAEDAKTKVYRFGLLAGKVEYKGKGEVPGIILNQFSMDEDKSYFRIATTTGEIWREDENTSKNNIYVLDREMNIAGKLEGVAPGEKIYSTRFMGDRVYMVTFRTVDPLFVIDLQDPAKPAILGKLKIPGYSDYLHPYDEKHIIGFGKETIELKDRNGEPQAYDQGMKVALFDVSDVNNPREISHEIIGDRGTHSELLYDHKALLFSREKNLLAFPVTVSTLSEKDKKQQLGTGFPAYGKFSFQGAYVYQINLKRGFHLQGRITHLSPADYQRAGDYWYQDSKNIQRILYIGDNLYTLSQDSIKSHQITNLRELGNLPLH